MQNVHNTCQMCHKVIIFKKSNQYMTCPFLFRFEFKHYQPKDSVYAGTTPGLENACAKSITYKKQSRSVLPVTHEIEDTF